MATEEIDYYALIGVSSDASLSEIKSAYRKQSLKVHPDRNPDNPDAASLFHSLRSAFDVLSDPTTRSSYDALHAARKAKEERFAALNQKRRAGVEELERAEREHKLRKVEKEGMAADLERLKEQGRKLREQKEEEKRQKEAERVKEEEERRREERRREKGPVELGELDTTLKLKWTKNRASNLVDEASVRKLLASIPGSKGKVEVENVLMGKKRSAVVMLKTLRSAVKVMEAGATSNGGGAEWDGVEVSWAAGVPPAALGGNSNGTGATQTAKGNRLEIGVKAAKVEVGTEKEKEKKKKSPPSFAFPTAPTVPSFDGPPDEDAILNMLRDREKERAKLIAEMERQDAEEEEAAAKGAIATVSLGRSSAGHTLEKKMKAASEAGFEGIELFWECFEEYTNRTGPDETGDDKYIKAAKQLRLLSDSLSPPLSILVLQPFWQFDGLLPSSPALSSKLTEAALWLEIAVILGASFIQVPAHFKEVGDENYAKEEENDEVVESNLRTICRLAGEKGLTVAYEPMAWSTCVSTFEHAHSLIRSLTSRGGVPNLSFCLDTFHTLARLHAQKPQSPLSPTPLSGPPDFSTLKASELGYLQISDVASITEDEIEEGRKMGQRDLMTWSRRKRVPPFVKGKEGVLPVEGMVKELSRTGWRGWVSVETFNDEFWDESPEIPARLAKEGMESYLKTKALLEDK